MDAYLKIMDAEKGKGTGRQVRMKEKMEVRGWLGSR